MDISGYVKEHPWATGIIALIGGFIFIMIVRGGGSSGGTTVSGPSDAQVMADAQVQAAQIAAQAQAAQAGAAVQATQIGANVQLNSDNKAAEVAMRALDVQKDLGIQEIDATHQENMLHISQAAALTNTAIGFKKLSGDQKVSLINTFSTGQATYAPSKYNTMGGSTWFPQAGNTAGGIISSIGGLASSLGSIFSDQRLKENIKFLGYDEKGVGVYEWNYKGSKRKHIGYIAQDVMRSHPDAVEMDPGTGYWKVNVLQLASI